MEMTAPQNVELEAAKFLQKLIQDSTDEPTKLATKLHVILQHMRSSGKENSMPYQVISRAMETVINQHNLDIEALMQSRIPMAGGTQAGDSATSQFAGSSQRTGVAKDSKFEHEMARNDAFISNRSPVGPSGAVHDIYQGSVSHMNSNKPFDHESPSSFDTRSANSQSQVSEKDSKRSSNKRKRADPSLVIESHNMQPPDSRHLSRSSNLKNPEDIEVSSAHNSLGLQQGGRSIPLTQDGVNSRSLRNQNNAGGFPFEKSQASRFSFPNAAGNSSQEIGMHHSSPSSLGSGAVSKIHGGVPGNMGSYAASEQMNPNPHFSSSYDNNALVANMSKDRSVETYSAVKHEGGIQSSLANANKVDQGGFPNTVAEMTMLRNAASRDTGKSPISQGTTVPSMPFKEQHLKQLRAQCLVYLAFRNGLMPKKLHLDIALGNIFPIEDGTGKELIDHKEKEHSINDPSSNPEVKMPFGRTENSNMAVERIGSASGPSEHAEETESLEKISVSASISEETAVPIVDSDFKETEDQSAKMDVDEPESTVHALVSDSSEVSLGQKRSPSQPLVTAEPFVESGIVEETEDQSENMDTVEAVISDPGDACLDDKTSLNPPVDTPETEILEKNSVATSILEETAVPIAKPDLKETEDQSAKMAVEPESTVQALISDSSEVSLEEKISPSQPLVTAEPFVESCIVEELGVEVAASKESDSNEKMTDLGKPVEEDSDAKIDEVEGSFAAADGTDLEAKVKLVDYSPDDSLDRDVSTPLNDG